jgi:hypothetical protein
MTFTGSHKVTFYSEDYITGQTTPQTNSYGASFNFDLVLSDTGNDTVFGGNANGDIVHAGGGTDSVTLGTGAGDALFGGTGANQSLSVAGANATLTDGAGAHQTLTATGGNSTFNIGHGPSDIINSQGGNNTINVVAFAGTETINGTSTDTLNLNDYAKNGTITQLSGTETQIVFSDTGQIIDVTGITNINYLTPPPPPPPSITSQDLSFSAITGLLASDGLDATDTNSIVTWLTGHSREAANGLAPVETISNAAILADQMTPNGFVPQLLIDFPLGTGSTLNTTSFPKLHDVVVAGVGNLEVTGSGALDIYQAAGNSNIDASASTGNDMIIVAPGVTGDVGVLGSAAGSTIVDNGYANSWGAGSGAKQKITTNGTSTSILGGSGDSQHFILNGASSEATAGTGANAVYTFIGSGSTFFDSPAQNPAAGGGGPAGNNLSLNMLGGSSHLFNGNAGTETVKVDSGNNILSIGTSTGALTIKGLEATDTLYFADGSGTHTITTISKTEVQVSFADTGAVTDLHFANHAAEVAVIGSIHWGAIF